MSKRDYTKTLTTRKQTQERHAHMRCITRELEIEPRSQAKRDYLERLFLEGKWLTNYYIQLHKAGLKWSDMPTTDTAVAVKHPLGWQTRTLYALPSSSKQGVRNRLRENEKSIISNIKNGHIKHGELHFISNLDSIPLPNGNWQGDKAQSYTIHKNKKRVAFQGDDRVFKILGGEQIPDDAELANAKIIRRASKYYLHVTFYIEWDEAEACIHTEKQVITSALALNGTGLDFGIDTNVTLDTGEKFDWWFGESDRMKRTQAANQAYRASHRRAYGWARSSNAQKKVMVREYDKLKRRKQDAVNKFLHDVRSRGGFIAVQDEQIKSWHANERYSEMVQHSILGGIMERLKQEPSTLSVSKWTRTTGVCPDCGHVLEEKLDTDVREWDCPDCGTHHDRDVASARTILLLAAVSASYPSCPVGVDGELFSRLLHVLGLECPDASLSRSGGLNPERLRTVTGIEH